MFFFCAKVLTVSQFICVGTLKGIVYAYILGPFRINTFFNRFPGAYIHVWICMYAVQRSCAYGGKTGQRRAEATRSLYTALSLVLEMTLLRWEAGVTTTHGSREMLGNMKSVLQPPPLSLIPRIPIYSYTGKIAPHSRRSDVFLHRRGSGFIISDFCSWPL